MLLHGVRVLDLSRLLPGGYCTRVLADAGARVVKVEPPEGDPLRQMPGGQAMFEALHHGKELLRLDWRSEPGRERLWTEIVQADVLVEGFRPGVMERAGLGYAALQAANPGLVYCAITGYGPTGPLAARAGHDLNYLARSGALSLMPRSLDGTPGVPGIQLADHAGGLHAAFLIAAALLARGQTGRGVSLDVSMTAVIQGWTALPRAAVRTGTSGPPLTGTAPCYHVYPVKDGYLSVAALEPKFWRRFCQAIEREDLDARQFDESAIPEVEGLLRGRTRTQWMDRFFDQDACVAPCLELEEVDEG